MEIKQISLEGDSVDLGATDSPNNITHFFYRNNGKITYLDKFKKDKEVIQIDLEKYPKIPCSIYGNKVINGYENEWKLYHQTE